ncbi:thioredoxin-dependent thiol peroxidase [Candidatus Saccharibacteria bacterium]|nr:thioredoxin-dependent thiol peroxidase [Candidatus Saccharibacteria bacterium]
MKPAPYFELKDQNDTVHKLSDYQGQWVVIYFYPKDDTPGCTTEACDFRDARDALAEYGNAVVIGISKDSVASHRKFADKHNLKFTLLSDPSHETIEAYGAWGPKKFMGREFLGIKRNTYIVDPNGNIVKEYQNVTPKTHVGQILKDLKALQTTA